MKHLFFSLALLSIPCFALADELPKRRAGLWEIRMDSTSSGDNQIVKQCIDAATDKAMLQVGTQTIARLGGACTQPKIKKFGAEYTTAVTCTLGNIKMVSTGKFLGNFDTQYVGESNSIFQPPFMGVSRDTTKIKARWVGVCASGQRPGDTVLDDGTAVNIEEIGNLENGMSFLSELLNR